jgi:hypothetical protein
VEPSESDLLVRARALGRSSAGAAEEAEEAAVMGDDCIEGTGRGIGFLFPFLILFSFPEALPFEKETCSFERSEESAGVLFLSLSLRGGEDKKRRRDRERCARSVRR